MSFKEIKNEARAIYKRERSGLIGANLVSFIIKITPIIVICTMQFLCMQSLGENYGAVHSALFGFAYILSTAFILLPLIAGDGAYFTCKAKGNAAVIDKIFCAFKEFKTRGTAMLVPFVIILLEVAVFNILSTFAYTYVKQNGMIASAVVMLVECVTVVYTLIAFSPLTYVLETYGNATAPMAVSRTLKISAKRRGKIFLMYLSFIGWGLLGIITLGIGFIWIMPYIKLTMKLMFKNLDN